MARNASGNEKLIAYIEEQIAGGNLPAGCKIPSLRELQEKFSLSYGSCFNAIQLLCERGLLEKRARSGIFVAKRPMAALRRPGAPLITVFLIRRGGFGLYPTALSGIEEAAEELGVELQVCPLPENCFEREMFVRLSCDSDGVILLYDFDPCVAELPRNKPCVGVMLHNSDQGRISLVDIDPFVSAELAVEYFLTHSVDQVRAITASRETYQLRAELFARKWEERTGKSCPVKPYAYSIYTALPASESLNLKVDPAKLDHPELFADMPPGCGLFFSSDNMLYDYSCIYRHLFGRSLVDDFTVLGVDGKRLLSPDFPVFPTIAVDWRRIGRRALEECLERIRHIGRQPARIYLAGQLVTE